MNGGSAHWTDTVIPQVLDLANTAEQRATLAARTKTSDSPAAWVLSHQVSTAMPMLLNVAMRMKTLLNLERQPTPTDLENFLREKSREAVVGFARSRRQTVESTPSALLPSAPRNREEMKQFTWEMGAEFGHCTKALQSTPFFLTGDIAHEVLAAEPMPSDYFSVLRLPTPEITVWVGEPLVFSQDFLATKDTVAQHLKTALDNILPGERESTSLELLGVSFKKAEDGSVSPRATVFVRTSWGRADHDPVWGGLTSGVNIDLSQPSVFTALAVNMLGVVAFEEWKQPDKPPPAVAHLPATGKEFRKMTGRSTNAQILGLRTVNLTEPDPDAVRAASTDGSGRKITEYQSRRGHWRRSRIGPRATWNGEYRIHYIRRVEINAHLKPETSAEPLYVPTSSGDGYQPYFESGSVTAVARDRSTISDG